MSDPGITRPFSPAELDALEDGLAQLHGEGAFALAPLPDDGDAIVRQRLASYRAITRLTRDALRSHEAPAHVIEHVLALAGAAAAEPTPVPDPTPARPSWWTRIRAAWTIPLVASAAAAAIVAIVVVPSERASDRAESTIAERSPAAAPTAARDEEDDAPQADQRLAMVEPEPLAGFEGEIAEAQELRGDAVLEQPSAAARDAGADAPKRRARGSASSASSEAKSADRTADEKLPAAKPRPKGPAAPPAPNAAPTSKSDTRQAPGGGTSVEPTKTTKNRDAEALARGDALRRSGDCKAAVKLYDEVRTRGTNAQRAKALVGLALCAEREGDRDRADDLLAKARAADASSDAYYDSER